MFVGSAISIFFITSLLLPAYKSMNLSNDNWYFSSAFVSTIICVLSLINGYGQGIGQTAYGKYISDCASEKTKGLFFAIIWSFYMGSVVAGNLISAYLLDSPLGQVIFSYVMIGFTIIATLVFLFMRKPFIHTRES